MSASRSRIRWAILNAVGLGFALVANGLANGLPLNGMNTGELSALYPNLSRGDSGASALGRPRF